MDATPAVAAPVDAVPLPGVLLRLLVPAALWGLVVAGRRVCLVAQRLPPVVRLVRAVYRWKDARARRALDRGRMPR